MNSIIISEEIKQAAPKIKLGVILADVFYDKQNQNLWAKINEQVEIIQQKTTEEIKQIPQILTTREAYKNLGKEPSRYRPSAEALHRRLIKGKGMYKINNLVDAINFASILTGYSIGGYDRDKIIGDITFLKGKKEDDYKAIGRGFLNIENLPVFSDEAGPFGSPTSDSERTMITQKTKNVLWIVINFGGHDDFKYDLERFAVIINDFCSSKNIEISIL